jgi:YD repeat-containing protein
METGSVTNELTFNAADQLTRVDKPSNAYDTFTYDYNGNLTQMDRYYPTLLLSGKETENDRTSSCLNVPLLKVHYPSDYAPSPVNKWSNLSPYLPNVGDIDPIMAKLSTMMPGKAKWDMEARWRNQAMPNNPNMPFVDPDETTTFTYSSDNNLTHTDLPDGSDLDFTYDAAGRRLTKTYTKVINNVTHETKYTYHYIGSQLTTIEIDGKEDTTVVKDDEMRIHLGANSRPISFEYYTENQGTQQTTSATYYYHYDLHGNVIRVTNSSGTTVITYTYDPLGNILTESNSNSIYNPFTYMGEAQVIHDSEFDTSTSSPKTGLYNSGSGYYNPETGTFLGGAGAPVTTNPTSITLETAVNCNINPDMERSIHIDVALASSMYIVSNPVDYIIQIPSISKSNGVAYDDTDETNLDKKLAIGDLDSFMDGGNPNANGSLPLSSSGSNDSGTAETNSSSNNNNTQSVNRTSPCCGGGIDLGINRGGVTVIGVSSRGGSSGRIPCIKPGDCVPPIVYPCVSSDFPVKKACIDKAKSATTGITPKILCSASDAVATLDIFQWIASWSSLHRMRQEYVQEHFNDRVFVLKKGGTSSSTLRGHNGLPTVRSRVFDKLYELADKMIKWVEKNYELYYDVKMRGGPVYKAELIKIIMDILWKEITRRMLNNGFRFVYDDKTGEIYVSHAGGVITDIEGYMDNEFENIGRDLGRDDTFNTGLDRMIMNEFFSGGYVRRKYGKHPDKLYWRYGYMAPCS